MAKSLERKTYVMVVKWHLLFDSMIGRKCIPGKIILGIKSYSEIDVTLSTHKTRKKGFAKSVDPDETARTSRLIRIYILCLFSISSLLCFCILFSIFVYPTSLILKVDNSIL